MLPRKESTDIQKNGAQILSHRAAYPVARSRTFTENRAASQSTPPDARWGIILEANSTDRSNLAGLLDKLTFGPVYDQAEIDTASRPSPESCVAAIVSDGLPDALETCSVYAKTVPVILISDETGFEFRAQAARSGVTALVRRPVNGTEISEWLQVFSDRRNAHPFNVLIIDDDWLTAEVAAEVLRSDGVMVSTVNDPTLALDVIQEQQPDLILMDIQMPGIDGVELTRVIRQVRQFFSVPVVFLSAERDESRQIEARKVGGDDFCVKPIVPSKLVSLVRMRADRSKQIRFLIERDRLTGLYGQAAFRERTAQELQRSSRTGCEIILALIDVDHFKLVNDRHGHLAGDHVLRTLAATLVSSIRRTDIIGRCGGEEFGVLLLDTSLERAATVIDRIRQVFADLAFHAPGETYHVTFSAGLFSSRGCKTTADLLTGADTLLYESKRLGRNRVRTGLAEGRASA